MAKNIEKLHYRFQYADKNISGTMTLGLGRFEGQYSRAQYELDSMVMASMEPFMPKDTSTFINVTKAMSASIAGSGKVVAAASPMGRFLYEGKVMVDEKTGSAFARKGAKKVLVSQFGGLSMQDRDLNFSKAANTKAQAHWFEPAKQADGAKWTRKVKRIAGGGTNGK